MSLRKTAIVLAMGAAALLAGPAGASVVVLGFEGVNLSYPSATYAQIQGFYDGGTSSVGTSGTNFGISFGSNAEAVCLNALGGNCSNASRNGTSATSGQGALGLASGGSTYLDFATAYTGAIAFRYQVDIASLAFIQAFDGVGGTGTALTAPLALFSTAGPCPGYNATLCHMGPGGLGFVSGARSVVFSGAPGHFVFDDLTFGAGNDPLSPPALANAPEPGTWALMLAGVALAGAALRRKRLGLRPA